ncbi:MAG: gamma carbonic anhydrase family protein [Gammaproteobacteria bacterium]|nr:MAG: gamma carbonic anhydrase family protein [Gammaproteobacteria bacterium]
MTIRSYEAITPSLAEGVYVDPTALVIGDVEIGEHSSVWPMTVIRGDVQSIRIGKVTSIQDASVLHVTHRGPHNPEGFSLQIGDYVTVGHKVTLHGCTIDDYCLIGMGSIVMDGAHLHKQVILGAGSLVPPGKVLESGYLWVGSPVKKIRPLTEKELAFLGYSAEGYKNLKQKYLDTLTN